MNKLYFGDSLDILKQLVNQHPEGFIDLVYLDPPFNKNRKFNVIFETVELKDAKAQKEAFADTWSNVSYKDTIEELKTIDLPLSRFLAVIDTIGISKGAVSYLTTMAIRIYYIHKVLKPAGSFYLHCDPLMSGYLRLVCDLIFGEKNFRSEIVWKRGVPHNDAKNYGANHDVILYYAKSNSYVWNAQYIDLSAEYIDKSYTMEDESGRKYQLTSTTAPGNRGPKYEFLGVTRYWRYTEKNIKELYEQGLIIQTKPNTIPRFKRYLDEQKGIALQDFWDDIKSLQGNSNEFLGYPTQKPVALLERIIKASSNEGDLIADFFCGCGTTIAAAQKLNRNWIGVDISHLAIGLIRKRLIDTYDTSKTKPEKSIIHTFTIDGLPKDIGSAKALALVPKGRMHFQNWVIETLLGGVANARKTGDGGYDGYTTIEIEKGKKEIVLIEVKSGNIGVSTLRSFAKTVQQQNGSVGILVYFKDQITKGMLSEAKGEGYFRKEDFDTKYDKIQILSVEDLLEGKQPNLPRSTDTGPFRKAEKAKEKEKGTGKLFE